MAIRIADDHCESQTQQKSKEEIVLRQDQRNSG